jgi:hypothetical protein
MAEQAVFDGEFIPGARASGFVFEIPVLIQGVEVLRTDAGVRIRLLAPKEPEADD